MRTWLEGIDFAANVVVLAGSLLALQHFASNRWKRRFRAFGSPLVEPPAYRVLFLLVVVGVVLIGMLPEAAFVLPVLDSVGLDIVTIFAALELRHYLASAARVVGILTGVAAHLHKTAQAVSQCGDVLRTNPLLSLYACMWLLIWVRMLTGTMKVSPPTQL